MSEWVFWCSVVLILYPNLGYPLLLLLISLMKRTTVQARDITPLVSMIIAVHNEEEVIGGKIENVLALTYPAEKLEVIVVSDCSTDSTNDIVTQWEKRGVKLLTLSKRMGKHHAQKLGIDHATGDILAFTDAAPLLDKKALLNMVRNFADPSIGCVSSEDRVIKRDGSQSEEGTYIRFEMFLRRLESSVSSLIGLSGSFFGIRRELCEPWSGERSSDFLLALRSYQRGSRSINDSTSIHFYKSVKSGSIEFERKVRTVMNGMAVLFDHASIMNPLQYGFYSVQVISHKLCRWLAPFFLMTLFIANILLISTSVFYLAFGVAQVLFYLTAVLAFAVPSLGKLKIFNIASFLCLANSAILVAWYELFRGKSSTYWQPSQR